MKWVSVLDALPEFGEEVLVCNSTNGLLDVGNLDSDGWFDSHSWIRLHPTHWARITLPGVDNRSSRSEDTTPDLAHRT